MHSDQSEQVRVEEKEELRCTKLTIENRGHNNETLVILIRKHKQKFSIYKFINLRSKIIKTMATRNSQTLMQTGDETFDFLFKIVLIGDCSVGKTKIVQRFKTGNFTESHANTIGVDFSMKTITVDGKKVKVCTNL